MTITGAVFDGRSGCLRFYERLLGVGEVECEGPRTGYPSEDGWAKLRSPAGDMKMEFQLREQHCVAPTWPPVQGEQQMMIHLDIEVEDLDFGVSWALECGAQLAAHQPQGGVRVIIDPAGHPFCLF